MSDRRKLAVLFIGFALFAGLSISLVTAFTSHNSSTSAPNSQLCTNSGIQSTFTYYANQLASETGSPVKELITLNQVEAVAGARLKLCQGHLSPADTAQLKAIAAKAKDALNGGS